MTASFRTKNAQGTILLWVALHACIAGAEIVAPVIPPPEERCAGVPKEEWSGALLAERLGVGLEHIERVQSLRELSIDDLCSIPTEKLARAFRKAQQPRPDSPGEWAKFRALQKSVNGQVKADGLYQGYMQRQAMLQTQQANGKNATAPIAGIVTGQWTALGPGNIGGRVRTIAINPLDANHILLGSVSGGIWKSTNGGGSWAPVNDFMGNLAVSSLVFDRLNPNVVYAGTGEGFFPSDAVRGFGVFRSTDAGQTWSLLPSTNPGNADFGWFWVNRLAAHGSLVVAATRTGVFRSTDFGNSWTRTLDRQAFDVRIDTRNSDNVVVGHNQGYVSASADGGRTWTTTLLGQTSGDWVGGRVEIAFAKSQYGSVYASADIGSGAVYKSTNGGFSWSLVSDASYVGNVSWYNNAIWVDPTNSEHIIIGGLNLKRSFDGGRTFSLISKWEDAPYSPHADHHAIVSDPDYDGISNRTVYFGNDGGIYKAANIYNVNSDRTSNGWTNLNNGLAITQFYSGAGVASAGPRIIGGTQDNGSLIYTGTDRWSTFFGGDGGYSAIDPNDGNYIYGEYVYLSLHRSTTGLSSAPQANWICDGIGDAWRGACGGTGQANFIAPFILDPNNSNTMLAGGASLWRSVNIKAGTPTWSSIKPSIGSLISSIAVAKNNSDIIWVGYNDGTVFKTVNGRSTSPIWTMVKGPNYRMALKILIDQDSISTVYVTYGGYDSGNVYKTVDAGNNWTDISGALPQTPVRSFARHPLNANWLYAGTEVGVFASTNGGGNWSVINDGPANVDIDDLFWFDNTTLVAATHGRGIFKTTVASKTEPVRTIRLSKIGNGSVLSNPAGISCGASCTTVSATYSTTSKVLFTAIPDDGSAFVGWSGVCAGVSYCAVSPGTSTVDLGATFEPSKPADRYFNGPKGSIEKR